MIFLFLSNEFEGLGFIVIIILITLKLTYFSKENIEKQIKEYKNNIKQEIINELNIEINNSTYTKEQETTVDKEQEEYVDNQNINYDNSFAETKENILTNNNIKNNNLDNSIKDNNLDNNSFAETKENILINNDIKDNNLDNSIKDNNLSISEIDENEKDENEKDDNLTLDLKIKYSIKSFFSTNIMAKIGGILLSLGLLFFMSLIYTYLNDFAKIIIGFSFGFILFLGAFYLGKKGYSLESKILFGVSILINYIVILSGRFILGGEDGYLGPILTFILLLMNTGFSVYISYTIKSNNILLFSIFFAYIIPFLIGGEDSANNILLIIIYSVFISLASLASSYIKNKNGEEGTSIVLNYFSIILGSLLILTTSISTSHEYLFILQLLGFNLIVFLNIYFAYTNNYKKHIINMFVASFVLLLLFLIVGVSSLGEGIQNIWIILSYVFSLFGINIFILYLVLSGFIVGQIIYLFYVSLFLFFVFVLSFNNLLFFYFIFPLILFLKFLILYLIFYKSGKKTQFYIFIILIGVFILYNNGYLFMNNSYEITLINYFMIFFTSLIYLLFSYFFSFKKGYNFLYVLGTYFFIAIFTPFIDYESSNIIYTLFFIIIFNILSFSLPIFNKNLIEYNIYSLIKGLLVSILYVIFSYYELRNSFGISINFGYFVILISIICFIIGYYISIKNNINILSNEKLEEKQENIRNSSYLYIFSSVLIFMLSIIIIFSDNIYGIDAFARLCISSIVFLLYSRTSIHKLLVFGIIIFTMGIIKYFASLGEIVNSSSYEIYYIFSFLIILLILYINIIKTKKAKDNYLYYIYFLHFLGILITYGGIYVILNSYFDVNLLVYLGIVNLISYISYKELNFPLLLKVNGFIIYMITFFQLFITNLINPYFYNYIFTLIILIISFLDIYYYKLKYKYLTYILIIYILLISSIYIYNIVGNHIALTIYWGLISLFSIYYGFIFMNPIYRSFGLLIISITITKMLMYDIWANLDNGVIRVFAFMLIGSIMIYLSMLYGKYKISAKSDFNILIDKLKN
ncbi:hypothetical protein [Candidatus Vampirococcus lugosii]|uniref:hypothetical protein n=1 Tax=Candidatus Vampirococcus lugosii TaxID=2789015 RepID=UPI001BCB5F23|nr:hypothetical protein [Candidatus Vampirococcus lugosii]